MQRGFAGLGNFSLLIPSEETATIFHVLTRRVCDQISINNVDTVTSDSALPEAFVGTVTAAGDQDPWVVKLQLVSLLLLN